MDNVCIGFLNEDFWEKFKPEDENEKFKLDDPWFFLILMALFFPHRESSEAAYWHGAYDALKDLLEQNDSSS